MIAKRIPAPQGGAGYQRLSAYVLNVGRNHREATDPASWTRLGAYVLDDAGAGEKVAWARATNCAHDDPGWAVRGILATQARNTRSRSDKNYHLVVSFPDGERPTGAQIEDVENRLCAAIGYADHERVSAVHQNTDNWHLHVAINKVHPQSFRNVTPVRDHFRLQEACAELEIRHSLIRERHTTLEDARGPEKPAGKLRGRAAEFARQHGGQTFTEWTRENAAAALLAAKESGKGWPELHRVAAAHGLVVKPRGAGLVIGHADDGRLHVKASDIDRDLSFQALMDAMGPFERAGEGADRGPKRTGYTRTAPPGPLYEAFRRERAAAAAARAQATADLKQRHIDHARRLAAYHRERYRQEKLSGLRGALRRESFHHLAAQRKRDDADRRAREAQERRALRERFGIPQWQAFLEGEAARGNEAALAALRSRDQRRQRMETELLEAASPGEARDVLYRHLHPVVRRDGRVLYRVADGGLVSDEARQIRVGQVSTGAAFLALNLAAERFGARPLMVRGSEEFRQQVAHAAGTSGIEVTFADPNLDRERRSALVARAKDVDRGQGRGA